MLERTYRLQSWARAAAFPLIGLVVTAVMGAVVGVMQPSFAIECVPAGGFDARCEVREHTVLAAGTTAHFRLGETDVRHRAGGGLAFVTPVGTLDVGARLRGVDASDLKGRLDEYRAAPVPPGLKVRRGFSATPFLWMGPLAMLMLLVPAWGLGGTLVVRLREGVLRVRRDRAFLRGRDVEIVFPADDPPRITAVRSPSRRYRSQGVLWGEREGHATRLVSGAAYDVLARVAADVEAALRPPA